MYLNQNIFKKVAKKGPPHDKRYPLSIRKINMRTKIEQFIKTKIQYRQIINAFKQKASLPSRLEKIKVLKRIEWKKKKYTNSKTN